MFFRRRPNGDSPFLPPSGKPLPLRQIFVRPVIITVSNYAALAFLGTAHGALFSLFFSMPIKIGGLDFDPDRIGYIMGAYRAITAVFMAIGFPKLVRAVGEQRVFILAMLSFLLLWVLFPIVNLCAHWYGIGIVVWLGIAFMLLPVIGMDMAYGRFMSSVFLHIAK
jgi:hypothetical protein